MRYIDEFSTWVGKTFAWCILILTFTTSYEVFSRYFFGAPTEWAFDASYILYGTLVHDGGRLCARAQQPCARRFPLSRLAARARRRNGICVLFILFFFPGMLAFIYSGFGFAKMAWLMNERSAASPNGPIIWPFKWLIPITGVLMVLQGIVEVMRCIICIRTGEWPKRLHDVEELDKIMLEKAEHGDYAIVKELEEIGERKGAI